MTETLPDGSSVPSVNIDELIANAVEQALARQRAEFDDRIASLEAKAGRLPLTSVPEHAGGVGVDSFAPSWSQYDQELARRGEHPHQQATPVSADWLEHHSDVTVVNNQRVRKSSLVG